MSVTDFLREYARAYVYVRVRVGELQSSSLAACEPARDCACTRTPASMVEFMRLSLRGCLVIEGEREVGILDELMN